ncbi:MAG: aminotransferase class IV [Pseudomonadota bacterium]
MFELTLSDCADNNENAFSKGAAFIDGEFVPISEAKLPLLDWGFIRGDANQDTVSVWRGNFFRLEDHLTRFFRNIDDLRMVSPYSREDIADVLHGLVRRSGLREAYVQMIMTRGLPPIGSRDPRTCVNRFQAYCIPYVWIARPEQQMEGLSMHVSNRWRVPAQSVSPRLKHYHWLDFEMSLFDGYDRDQQTACCVNERGNVAEGPGFNIFAVFDGAVLTPENGVLDGMTRRTVLELCDELKVPYKREEFSPDQMCSEATEVFLSTTSGGVIPVTSLDGQSVGSGKPGPITSALHEAYWSKRETGWHATPVAYQ